MKSKHKKEEVAFRIIISETVRTHKKVVSHSKTKRSSSGTRKKYSFLIDLIKKLKIHTDESGWNKRTRKNDNRRNVYTYAAY
jgi:hypothetical protein